MFDVIKIPNVFGLARLERALDVALDGAAEGVKVDFDVTTQTWDARPDFAITEHAYGRKVATANRIYGYVEHGTPPHIIRPRGRGRLSFGTPYRAKTAPGVIGSTGGGSGGNRVLARVVRHPGTAPRNFAKTIRDKWAKRLPEQVQRAIASAIR